MSIATVLLYLSLRGIDWTQVWTVLKSTRIEFVGWMVLVTTVSLFLRAFRWCVLLRAGGRVEFATAFWATCAGYFGNSYLPARAGELIRTMAVDAETGIGRAFVLTTALSERITDAISLVLISSLVLLTLPVRPGWYNTAAKPFAIIGFCGAVGIAVLPKLERLWHSLLARAPVPDRFRGALTRILDQILNGLRSFHDSRRLLTFLALTAVIWFMDAIATMLAARSLGIQLDLALTYLLLTGLGLGSALPSTPGFVGIYQFVAVGVLTPFGYPRTSVIALTLLLQALNYVSTGVWGLLALLRFRRRKPIPERVSAQSSR